jgi:hypothetical protein
MEYACSELLGLWFEWEIGELNDADAAGLVLCTDQMLFDNEYYYKVRARFIRELELARLRVWLRKTKGGLHWKIAG